MQARATDNRGMVPGCGTIGPVTDSPEPGPEPTITLDAVEYGDPDGPIVLAVHGLTGHARRWGALARTELAELRVLAPSLIGHGQSPWRPPWDFETHVDALSDYLDSVLPPAQGARPVVLVGHSFGGALAIRLAARRPELFAGLVLLDPAQGLDPEFALEVATASLDHWDYADADAARAAKRAEGWAQVPDDILDAEIAQHLIARPSGRVGWRVSAPMAAAAWSEMSRPAVLPPPGLRTHVVVADRVQPPFVGSEFLDACAIHRAAEVTIHHADCEHMVPFLEPALCGQLIRSLV